MKTKRNSIAIAPALTCVDWRFQSSPEYPKPTATEAAGHSAQATGSDDASGSTKGSREHWEIAGELSEACTCAVPCTCNFGDGPSPHHYCYALFSLDIEKGHYGDLILDGLHLAGAHGKNGEVWYLYHRATPEQSQALKLIAVHIRTRKNSYLESTHIYEKVGQKGEPRGDRR